MEDDKQAVLLCQKGNPDGFSDIYDRYIKKIYGFVYVKTYHKETAEDLTSTIFTKAFENISRFDASTNFSAWIFRIAKNTIIDHYRTKKDNADLDKFFWLDSGVDVAKDTDDIRKLEEVKKYLKNLTKEQKEIVIMRVWNEMSYAEIAEVLGKQEASCRMSFSRSLKKIKDDIPLGAFLLFFTSI